MTCYVCASATCTDECSPQIAKSKMNERIQELALEVFSFKHETSPDELNPGHHMDHIHKFAELIVHECVNAVDRSSVCFTADQVRIKQLAISALRKTFQG